MILFQSHLAKYLKTKLQMKSLLIIAISLFLCTLGYAQTANTLTQKEKQDGWKLLFDGKDMANWHKYGGGTPGKSWKIDMDAIKLDVPVRAGNKAPDGGDLVTNQVIDGDFEFKVEWKIEKYTNSGIFLFVHEDKKYPQIYSTGLELQVIDDNIYEGAKENTHRAGDFFGVANARLREINPVGQWNKVHVVVKNNKLTVSQNGFIVQEHNLLGEEWKKGILASKINGAPIAQGDFSGRIGLQDWGSTVWFRNIKLKAKAIK